MDEQHDLDGDGSAVAESDFGGATLGADLDVATAEREIADAVSARHAIARKYIARVRRRHPVNHEWRHISLGGDVLPVALPGRRVLYAS